MRRAHEVEVVEVRVDAGHAAPAAAKPTHATCGGCALWLPFIWAWLHALAQPSHQGDLCCTCCAPADTPGTPGDSKAATAEPLSSLPQR